ncbi:MAG: metallophosphoesterase, partial [Spirochaetaceae bacterium]|nr:metallophosphoesterase [Spirochaetaceae bacterium]
MDSQASPDHAAATGENPGRTIFVGDIHGCRAEFEALLQAVDFAPGRDRLLLTGDAFTRGPDPLGVWRLIQAT